MPLHYRPELPLDGDPSSGTTLLDHLLELVDDDGHASPGIRCHPVETVEHGRQESRFRGSRLGCDRGAESVVEGVEADLWAERSEEFAELLSGPFNWPGEAPRCFGHNSFGEEPERRVGLGIVAKDDDTFCLRLLRSDAEDRCLPEAARADEEEATPLLHRANDSAKLLLTVDQFHAGAFTAKLEWILRRHGV